MKIRAAALSGLIVPMWLVWMVDWITPGSSSIAGHGIVPRTWVGLEGIPAAPFIHANVQHLLANTIPLIVLGVIVLLRGAWELMFVVITTVIVGGMGTWLFGEGNAQHIGASGVVFGLFGYLLFRTVFDRRWTSALITLAVAVFYGTAMLSSLIPRADISWSGHFFGFIGGFLAARWRYPRRERDVRAAAGR